MPVACLTSAQSSADLRPADRWHIDPVLKKTKTTGSIQVLISRLAPNSTGPDGSGWLIIVSKFSLENNM